MRDEFAGQLKEFIQDNTLPREERNKMIRACFSTEPGQRVLKHLYAVMVAPHLLRSHQEINPASSVLMQHIENIWNITHNKKGDTHVAVGPKT